MLSELHALQVLMPTDLRPANCAPYKLQGPQRAMASSDSGGVGSCDGPTKLAATENVTTHTIRLNDGRDIPTVGLGVYQSPPDGPTYNAVLEALRLG